MSTEIREMVIFAPQSLIMDPPFTKLDILSCRNLLIYLAPEMQKKLIPLFHYSLSPGGILFLGSAESVGGFSRPLRIPRRQVAALPAERVHGAGPSPSSSRRPSPRRCPPGSRRARRTQGPGQPSIPRGSTGPGSFRPAGGARQRQGQHPLRQRPDGEIPRAGRRQGELEHLRHGSRGPALRAHPRVPESHSEKDGSVTLRGLKVGADGGEHFVDLTVQRLDDPEPLRGLLMIVFTDVPAPAETSAKPDGRGRPRSGASRWAELERKLPAGPHGVADHPRGDADLAGRAPVHQRGDAVHQRRAAVHQRGAHHLQGRDAIA